MFRKKKKQSETNCKRLKRRSHPNDESAFVSSEITHRSLFQIALGVRLASVLLVQTYFVPDEYWQSIEIAHLQVFGYGYKTWEWVEGVRGYTYPALFSLLYKTLCVFNSDYPCLLIYTPRVVQAFISAFADVKVFVFARNLFGANVAVYTYLLHLSAWFVFYTGSRTLSNTAEMACIAIGLGSYNWTIFSADKIKGEKYASLTIALVFCGLSCILRPTAIATWLLILLYELYYQCITRESFYFLKVGSAVASSVLALSTLLDYLLYGKLIIVHWRFLTFNLLQNLSGFYGSHSWHWYLTQGTPVVLFTHFPLILLELSRWKGEKQAKLALLSVLVMQLAPLSIVKHKEFRFLLPSLPLMVCLAGKGLHDFVEAKMEKNQEDSRRVDHCSKKYSFRVSCMGLRFVAIVAGFNAILAIYVGVFHQRGPIDVMKFLRSDLKEHGRNDAVLFLMPCHSTPYYSHLHMNLSMRFLECQPNFRHGYVEEADLFYSNPAEWLDAQYSNEATLSLPTHITLFNILLEDDGVASFLKTNKFVEVARLFHTHFPEGRIGSHVVVFSRKMKS